MFTPVPSSSVSRKLLTLINSTMAGSKTRDGRAGGGGGGGGDRSGGGGDRSSGEGLKIGTGHGICKPAPSIDFSADCKLQKKPKLS